MRKRIFTLIHPVSFDVYEDQDVYDIIKEKIEKWDFVIASMKIYKEHFRIGSDFEIFLMRITYKKEILVFKNHSKV